MSQNVTDSNGKIKRYSIRDKFVLAALDEKDYPEPETVSRLLRHKYKVKEVPVIMRERQAGVSSISSLGKSVYYMCKVSLAILIERLR